MAPEHHAKTQRSKGAKTQDKVKNYRIDAANRLASLRSHAIGQTPSQKNTLSSLVTVHDPEG